MKKYSKIALTKSKGRIFKESVSKYRSPFQRDRDRIVHSASFRRLKHKTQVFVNTEGDHYRTRLTHSMEVAQIARSIARYLELNEDLAETLSLAHDLGHPPFGHAGEDSLNECMEDYGGFDHNLQTLRVVMFLENKYLKYSGLNLSIETLEGLLKHNGPVYELDLVDSLIGVKKFKVDTVKDLVLKSGNKNNPQGILDTIDFFGWNKAFLMNIGDEKGLLLEKAIIEKNPKHCLELGVYLGYSSIRILRNLQEDSMLTSIEASNKYYEISKEIVFHSGLNNQWNPLRGKAKNVIPSLGEKYDFVFLDHWKDEYLSDLKTMMSLELLNDKAVIFADNVVLFNMEDYLSYVRNSSFFESKFISTKREYSKTQPDGIEISTFNKDD